MAILDFPPIEEANEEGLLAIGGDLEINSLLLAYSKGIFPWPISEDYPLAWFSPDPRGVLDFEDLHIPKSLKKEINKRDYIIKFNCAFDDVIKECAEAKNRKDQEGTWITEDIQDAYLRLHNAGYAYSAEIYYDEILSGGIYGVSLGKYVAGESMFYKKSNASKILLVNLVQFLKSKGVKWLDTQMVTPVIESLGGKEIPRKDFIKQLSATIGPQISPSII